MNILFVQQKEAGILQVPAECLRERFGHQTRILSGGYSAAANEAVRADEPQVRATGLGLAELRPLTAAVLEGQAVVKAALQASAQGFAPDAIIGCAGSGSLLFLKDLFPDVPLIGRFAADHELTGAEKMTLLLELTACDAGYSPTMWHKRRLAGAAAAQLRVIPDGVDLRAWCPRKWEPLRLERQGIDLTAANEVISCIVHEASYFDCVVKALALLQKKHAGCHVVIAQPALTTSALQSKGLKQLLIEESGLDLSRVHLAGTLPETQLRLVLQLSTVQLCLVSETKGVQPVLEAMACGGVVIAPHTEALAEVVRNGYNGLLFETTALSLNSLLERALTEPNWRRHIAGAARKTVEDEFALQSTTNGLQQLLLEVAGR